MWIRDVFHGFRYRTKRFFEKTKNFWDAVSSKICVVGWMLSGYLIGAAWVTRSILNLCGHHDLANKIPEPADLVDPGLIVVVGVSVFFSGLAAAAMYLPSSASRWRTETSAVLLDEVSSIAIGYGALLLFYSLIFSFDRQRALFGLGIALGGVVSFVFSYLLRKRLDRTI